MLFETCIRDELGTIVAWTSNMDEEEVEEMLSEHPEWSISEQCFEDVNDYRAFVRKCGYEKSYME